MKDWLWRLAFATLWFALAVVGASMLIPAFTRACDDCIGSYPGFFGYGGFVTDWSTVILVSLLNATVVTGLLAFWSRAFRRRLDSAL